MIDPDAPVMRAIIKAVLETKRAFEQEGLDAPTAMILGDQERDRLRYAGYAEVWGWPLTVYGVKIQ